MKHKQSVYILRATKPRSSQAATIGGLENPDQAPSVLLASLLLVLSRASLALAKLDTKEPVLAELNT